MRILITNQYRRQLGGIETYLGAIAPILRDKNHQLGWLFGENACSTSSICLETKDQVWVSESKNLSCIRSEILRWKPDIVYANGLTSPTWDNWLAIRFPTMLFAHAFFGTCISGNKCFSLKEHSTCKRALDASCLLRYHIFGCGGRNPLTMLQSYVREYTRKKSLKRFRAILVASSSMAEEYKRNGVMPSKLHVLPLFPTGVQPDLTAPKFREDWKNRVLLVGRLTKLKGAREAVKAVSIASKHLNRALTLTVAGDGPERGTILSDAQKLMVPIETVGWIDSETRNSLMRQADVLLVPSLWPEPFALVGIEAGCVGLPSVGFNVGGIPDWLYPGVSGEIAPANPPTSDGLADALVRALSCKKHYERLCYNAWKTSKCFSVDYHLSRLLELFKSCQS